MRLICKLLLGFEDEVLNATETLLYDKKVSCTKIDCLIHTILLVITCLLLSVIICVICYVCYKIYQPK